MRRGDSTGRILYGRHDWMIEAANSKPDATPKRDREAFKRPITYSLAGPHGP